MRLPARVVGKVRVGAHVYVTDQLADSVTVIETATNRVLSTVAVGMSPIDVAITPNGAFAYVANSGSNDLSVIEVATNRVIATVKVGVQRAQRQPRKVPSCRYCRWS